MRLNGLPDVTSFVQPAQLAKPSPKPCVLRIEYFHRLDDSAALGYRNDCPDLPGYHQIPIIIITIAWHLVVLITLILSSQKVMHDGHGVRLKNRSDSGVERETA